MKLFNFSFFLSGIFLLTGSLSAQDSITHVASVYERLVDGAQTIPGGVTTHIKNGVYYLEIPESALHRDIIWYAEINRGPWVQGMLGSSSSPGQMIDHRVIRMEHHADKLFLRDYTSFLDLRSERSAGPNSPMFSAEDQMNTILMETNLPPILMAIPIEAENPEGSVIVNATNIFGKPIAQFNAADKYPGLGLPDANRSYIESIKSFDNNLRVTSVLTYSVSDAFANPLLKVLGSINSKAAIIEIDYSLYVLPDSQMQPRLADPRLGYFKTDFTQEGDVGGVETKGYISRYRLEKKVRRRPFLSL